MNLGRTRRLTIKLQENLTRHPKARSTNQTLVSHIEFVATPLFLRRSGIKESTFLRHSSFPVTHLMVLLKNAVK